MGQARLAHLLAVALPVSFFHLKFMSISMQELKARALAFVIENIIIARYPDLYSLDKR